MEEKSVQLLAYEDNPLGTEEIKKHTKDNWWKKSYSTIQKILVQIVYTYLSVYNITTVVMSISCLTTCWL